MSEKHRWLKLGATALTLSTFMLVNPALAQDDAEDGEAAELERVEVTGSRIKRPEFTSPAPVTTITAEEISQTGLITLGDLLSELPQLSSTFTTQNSGRFIGTVGGGFLNLRGLGTDRTLVLINGRRHVAGSIGDASVDINSIPTDLIERIEISTGAQSAVYGADAVAGTVNIILRDNFSGVRARASAGVSDRVNDFRRYSAAITAGNDFIGGRGNAVVSIGWDRQSLLTAEEAGGRFNTPFGFVTNPEDGDTIDPDTGFQIDDGIPDDILVPNVRNWFIREGGAFFNGDLGGWNFFNPDGTISPVPFGDFEFLDGGVCGGANCVGLDLTSFQPLQVGFERFTFDTLMTYDFNDNVQGYAEVRYANVDANQQGQASFDNVPQAPIFADNAFLREDVRQTLQDAGITQLNLRRFNTDLGFREEFTNRQTARGVVGLRGAFEGFGRTFDYDLFANYGRTTVERVNENNRIDETWFAAIDAVAVSQEDIDNIVDGSFFAGGISAGDIVCRSTLLAAQGQTPLLANGAVAPDFAVNDCVPANIIGNGNISQAAIDFINSTAVATGEVEQFQTGFNVGSSDLVDLWGAGPIGALVGFEYRNEDARATEDSLSALGNTFFNALAAVDGSFDVTEYYGEIVIPVLRDLPLIQSFQIEAAGRISDYSTIGSVETWEGRFSWQPINDITVRGTIGQSVRAPTINDLFSPAGENFNIVNDPCDFENLDAGRNGRVVRIQNCQALGIADPETFDSNDEQSIPLLSGGNPNLNEEESDVWTIGFVWSPSFVRNLDISVDLWDIEISSAIAATGSQTILNRCVDDLNGINNQFCALVDRDGVGNIVELRQFPLNLNEFLSRGVDFGISYIYNAGDWGTFNFRTNAQYLDQRTFILNSEDNVDLDVGELGDPEWEGSFNVNWTRGNWGAFAQVRVIDEQLLVDQSTLFGSATNPDPNPDIQDVTTVDTQVYVDLGVNHTFPFGLTAQLAVDNVFDNICPRVLNECDGGGSAIFDNVGRFYNLELSWNF